MNFIFISPCDNFERWDFTTPDARGIGGSETSQIEMVRRLAEHGHSVHSYAPLPYQHIEPDSSGATWERFENVDFTRRGVWVVYRAPRLAERIPRDAGPVWLICQDVWYDDVTDLALDRVDRIVALCDEHAAFIRVRCPKHAHKVLISSNGIKLGPIEKLAVNPPVRDPHRLMYASSPDRGLWYLVEIFVKAREIVHDLTLHCFYGMDNINRIIEKAEYDTRSLVTRRDKLMEMMKAPGITWHGRVPQARLIEEWFKSGIWCYPSSFPETSCINSMESQACGAIPITNPIWAMRQNVQHGVLIEGVPQQDRLTLCRYANEVASLALDIGTQEKCRAEMMPWARQRFDWERVVWQWIGWAAADTNAAVSLISVPTMDGMEVCI